MYFIKYQYAFPLEAMPNPHLIIIIIYIFLMMHLLCPYFGFEKFQNKL